jgi:hypothetical protein
MRFSEDLMRDSARRFPEVAEFWHSEALLSISSILLLDISLLFSDLRVL